VLLTVAVALTVWGVLIWQYFHDGVPRHYLLHSSDMPSVSNWWGAILLPLLTWVCITRLNDSGELKSARAVLAGFFAAIIYGILLSVAFMKGHEETVSLMPPALLAVAFFVPIYQPQFFLGFIFGLITTFGAFLSAAFSVVIGLVSFVIYRYLRPFAGYFARKSRALLK